MKENRYKDCNTLRLDHPSLHCNSFSGIFHARSEEGRRACKESLLSPLLLTLTVRQSLGSHLTEGGREVQRGGVPRPRSHC